VGRACDEAPDCLCYHLEDRVGSVDALARMPGVQAAVSRLGYQSFDAFRHDARQYVEAVNLLATFCLMPPGDTPKRRGFIDAVVMGCGSRWLPCSAAGAYEQAASLRKCYGTASLSSAQASAVDGC
jgi:hypothetical protein